MLLCNTMVTQHNTLTDRAFAAISDRTRRDILDHLQAGELCAGDIAARFSVTRPAIARHIRVLKNAGLVKERRDRQRRIYSLAPQGLGEVDRWMQPYRTFWAARLTDLKDVVENDSKNEPKE